MTTTHAPVPPTPSAGAARPPDARQPGRHRLADDDPGLAGDRQDAPQPRGDVRRHHPAADLHRDVRLHLRRRDLRRRRQLPAAHHPRPDRADRAHGVRRHRRPAARPTWTRASSTGSRCSRSPASRRWPGRWSPTCCATSSPRCSPSPSASPSATAPAAGSPVSRAPILLAVVAGWSLAWIFTFFGLVGRNAQGVQGISLLVMFPLTFLSNAFVPTDTMPAPARGLRRGQPGLAGHHRAARPRQRRPGDRRGRLGAPRLRRRGRGLRAAVGASLQEDVSTGSPQPVHDRGGLRLQVRPGPVGQLLDELRRSVRAAPRRPARPSAPTPSPGCCGCRPTGGRSPAGVRRPRAGPAGRTAAPRRDSATSMTPLRGRSANHSDPSGSPCARPHERSRSSSARGSTSARPVPGPRHERRRGGEHQPRVDAGLGVGRPTTIVDDVVVAPDRTRVVAAGERELGLSGLPGQPGAHLGRLPVGLAELLEHRGRPVDVAVEQRRDRRGHPQAVGIGLRVDPGEQRPGDLGVLGGAVVVAHGHRQLARARRAGRR